MALQTGGFFGTQAQASMLITGLTAGTYGGRKLRWKRRSELTSVASAPDTKSGLTQCGRKWEQDEHDDLDHALSDLPAASGSHGIFQWR